VDWGILPSLIPTWLAMYFVVAFSSSLDVAAIQMELGDRALDFNHELMTVGLSNLISGCTGGFTGSYIFSQTLLSMRAGVRTRAVGIIVIILELAVFMLPFSILAYIPKFFFGAVLTFIAIELVFSWLFLSYKLVASMLAGMWGFHSFSEALPSQPSFLFLYF
jgi:SulP family sulfate permease